jgi:hypothetical protein
MVGCGSCHRDNRAGEALRQAGTSEGAFVVDLTAVDYLDRAGLAPVTTVVPAS